MGIFHQDHDTVHRMEANWLGRRKCPARFRKTGLVAVATDVGTFLVRMFNLASCALEVKKEEFSHRPQPRQQPLLAVRAPLWLKRMDMILHGRPIEAS